MATTTINSSTLTSGQDLTLGTLKNTLDKIITKAERNELVLGSDEYQLLHALRWGTTTGAGTVSGIVVTYT